MLAIRRCEPTATDYGFEVPSWGQVGSKSVQKGVIKSGKI